MSKTTDTIVHIPELPKLSAGYLVLREDAWNILLNYIAAQSSTINALADTVTQLQSLLDLRYNNLKHADTVLESKLTVIAQALEGELTDV